MIGLTVGFHVSADVLPAATTYHRGYPRTATAVPSTSFYDTRNPHGAHLMDPSAYRGSVLSSTTASSNQDELMQAYEYAKKQQQMMVGPNGRFIVPVNAATSTTTTGAAVPTNGVTGSGSSETTDPGICQFTQKPPNRPTGADGLNGL